MRNTPYVSRSSVPNCSSEVSARLQLHSSPLFQMSNVSSRISGVSDSCKMISRSRRAILGSLESNQPHKPTEYGILLKKGKPLPHSNSLNRTAGKPSKRILYLMQNKEAHKGSMAKNALNFSEVFQDLDTDVSIPQRNAGCNVNQTMDSRNEQSIFSQTSDELIHRRGGLKNSWKSPQSSSIRALRSLLALANKDRPRHNKRLETEEDPSIELTQETSFVLRQEEKVINTGSNDMKEKFEETTKCPIQTLLRPITAKNRGYRQRVKTVANKPYVIGRVSMKAKKVEAKKEEKCVCF